MMIALILTVLVASIGFAIFYYRQNSSRTETIEQIKHKLVLHDGEFPSVKIDKKTLAVTHCNEQAASSFEYFNHLPENSKKKLLLARGFGKKGGFDYLPIQSKSCSARNALCHVKELDGNSIEVTFEEF